MMPQRLVVKNLFSYCLCRHWDFLLFLKILARIQQQKPGQGLLRSSVPKNVVELLGKNLCRSLFFDKVAGLQFAEKERKREIEREFFQYNSNYVA